MYVCGPVVKRLLLLNEWLICIATAFVTLVFFGMTLLLLPEIQIWFVTKATPIDNINGKTLLIQ